MSTCLPQAGEGRFVIGTSWLWGGMAARPTKNEEWYDVDGSKIAFPTHCLDVVQTLGNHGIIYLSLNWLAGFLASTVKLLWNDFFKAITNLLILHNPTGATKKQMSFGGWKQKDFPKDLTFTRWWFPTFFIFIPIWERFPFWLAFFNWVETTN